jgi:hypothetical protein
MLDLTEKGIRELLAAQQFPSPLHPDFRSQ